MGFKVKLKFLIKYSKMCVNILFTFVYIATIGWRISMPLWIHRKMIVKSILALDMTWLMFWTNLNNLERECGCFWLSSQFQERCLRMSIGNQGTKSLIEIKVNIYQIGSVLINLGFFLFYRKDWLLVLNAPTVEL